MIRTQIQLTEEQSKALKQLSSQKNISVAQLIRNSVDLLLRSMTEISEEDKRRRALSIVGKFPVKEIDMSVNHDKYLEEVYGE